MSNDDSDSEDEQFYVAEHYLESEESSDEDDVEDSEEEEEEENEEVADWKLLHNQNSVAPDRFSFRANSGTKILHGELDILQYFLTFIDDYICNLLVDETNRYAEHQAGTSHST